MATDESTDVFAFVPRWWVEAVVGFAVTTAGVAGLSVGRLAVVEVIDALFAVYSSRFVVQTMDAYVVALVLVAGLYVAVGVAGTYAYLAYREFDPGFVVAVPEGEGAHWATALVWLAPTLVGVGAMADKVAGGLTGGHTAWDAPATVVLAGPPAGFPTLLGHSLVVSGTLWVGVLAGVVGPAVCALVHGVLQNNLRQVARPAVAAGATAVFLGAVHADDVAPIGFALLVAFAAVAGHAYERTGNLTVPMVGYAALNAAAQTAALVLDLPPVGQF